MRALFIGRFQPFHNGHLRLVKDILEKNDSITIVIGSAQDSFTIDNPFTAGERLVMVTDVLKSLTEKQFYVVPVEDVNSNSIWVSHVEMLVPKFDVVYTNNALVGMLFKQKGYRVESTPLYEREKISGTVIRKRMLEGEDWESLVPEQVGSFIQEVDGVKRISELSRSDKVPL